MSLREAQGTFWFYIQEAVDGHHHEKAHLYSKNQTRSFFKGRVLISVYLQVPVSGPEHFERPHFNMDHWKVKSHLHGCHSIGENCAERAFRDTQERWGTALGELPKVGGGRAHWFVPLSDKHPWTSQSLKWTTCTCHPLVLQRPQGPTL